MYVLVDINLFYDKVSRDTYSLIRVNGVVPPKKNVGTT